MLETHSTEIIIVAFFSFLTVCAQGYIAMVMKRLDTKQAEAKVDRAEIKTTLAANTAATAERLDEIHTLVNGSRGDILRSGALSARKLYAQNPTGENFALMNKAIEDLLKHEEHEEMIRSNYVAMKVARDTSVIPTIPGEEEP